MATRKISDYQRVEKAIQFINSNFASQPSLDEIAEATHLSPHHFQKMFSRWAGVSPKKFMQYISLNHAKGLLKSQMTLGEAAHATGLSGTGRLHDLFVNIEGMTPGEYKNGGANLLINYSFAESPFGQLIVASTGKGICHMHFETSKTDGLHKLKQRFPKATCRENNDPAQQAALSIFQSPWDNPKQVKLHLKGSPFQLKVWESLLKIPKGALSSYGQIAENIDNPRASRAVGTAIGNNPVAFLIPCHRVIQNSGKIGGYMWGPERKTAIIGWEAASTLG